MPNSAMSTANAPKKVINIPAGFREMLEIFAKDTLAEQPKDIPSFALDYFTKAKNEQLKREQEVTNHEEAELITKTSEKEVEEALRTPSEKLKVRQIFVLFVFCFHYVLSKYANMF